MRPQDEIKVALPKQQQQGVSFLLRRLAELPLTEDGAQFLRLVSGVREKQNNVSAALCEDALWNKLELERMHRSVGEQSGQGGTWSGILHGANKPSLIQGIQNASLAAGQKLEPVLNSLAKGASRGEAEAAMVARALGSIQNRRSIEILEKIAFEQGTLVSVMVAYARLGGEFAATKAMELVEAVKGTAVHPQLLATFASMPSERTFKFLLAQARGGNPALAAGVAAALEGFQAQDPLPVLDALLKIPDPWVMINAVETLGRIGGDDYLERIERIYDQHRHALIRISCLQAASGSTGEIAFRLAQRGLRAQDPSVQAAAVETMVTTGVPSQHYKDQVLPLMNSPNAKLALNACLTCMALEPRRAVQHVTGLISCGDPAKLLQSIHCLAYVESPVAYQALARIIKMCPPGVMRLEAVKSLGRLANRRPEAVGEFLPTLELADPEAQEMATYFLGYAHPEAQVAAAKALSKPVREKPESSLAVHCIDALGQLGPAGQLFVPDLFHALLKGPEPARVAARALVVAFPRSREAQGLAANPNAMMRGYDGLRSWFDSGEGMEGLAHALEDASPFVFQTACELVRMAGACGSWTQDTRRLVGLAKALGAAPLEAQDVDGLGRLDHSTVIPRKKIGLGIIPRPNPGASGLEENSFKLEAASFVEAQKTSESAFLAQSVYETTSIPQVSHQPEARPAAPRRTQEKPPIQPLDSPPSPTLPATVVPESRTKEILRWIGLGVLCVAAVLLGRYLKTLIG